MKLQTLALLGALSVAVTAAPPAPPADFVQFESATKPTPFPIIYVDQGQHDPRLAGLLAPAGFRVEIVAESPVVVNPTGLCFAPDGTLFVAEWTPDPAPLGKWFEVKETFRYQDGSTKQVATMKKFVVDPIKVLNWNKEKGVYDKSSMIIAEEIPSTLLWHDGWLYTASRGTVRRYKQARAGGNWEIRETIAQGFCGFHHHQVSGLTIGNDGKLYITSGDDDNFVEGSDGSRATVLRTGAVFRCNPDGSEMETYSLGYRNPYRDLCYDDKFNFFHADNDNEDGSKFTGCRLVHVAEGIDYGWRLKTGARCCRPDFSRGAVAGELPGKLPPMLKTGRGSPAGLLIYNDTKLPEHYRGLQYYPDVFRKLVRAYKVAPKGASFEVTHEFEFLKSADPLFRPCHMVTGPDGAIYVCDWRTDSGGAGRLSGDGVHGRIYRMTWTGTADSPGLARRGLDSWAKLVKLPTKELVAKLDAVDFTDRVEARKELVRRGEEARDAVLRRFVSDQFTAEGRLVALGVMQAHWSIAVEDLFRLLLNDNSPDVRRLAADALAQCGKSKDSRNHTAVATLLADDSPAVRRAAALAIARIGAEGAAPLLVDAWLRDDGKDAFLSDAWLRGIERLGEPGIKVLLAQSPTKLDRVVAAFAGFRSDAAATALPGLLNDAKLTSPQRVELVRSFANYQFDPPLSFEPLWTHLATAKPDTATSIAGLELFAMLGTDTVGAAWTINQLDSADPEVRLAALKAVDVAQLSAAGTRLTVILGDAKRPTVERTAALKALRTTAGATAAPLLIELINRDEPTALKADALRGLAAASPEQAKEVATKLLDGSDATLVAEAIAVLGATKDGARLIGERYVARRLPKEMFPRVSEVVKKFASEASMSKLHSQVMKGSLFLKMDAARVEEIRKLVETKGDPRRGKEIYLNAGMVNCASCHRLEGIGGNVGPDLTRLWDTQTIPKILEAITEPSKEIKEGYQSFKAATADGRSFAGLKVGDTAKDVTLREANGHDMKLLKVDLDTLAPSKTSLMPDDSIAQLSFEQFLDLVAFLKDRTAQESIRGTVLEFSAAVGFKSPLAAVEPFEAKPESKDVTWQSRAVDATGRLDLGPIWPADGMAAYALAYVHSPKPQKITLNIAADDALRVAVNGKTADIAMKGEPVIAEVPAGWSPILVKLAGRGPSHKLSMHVSGEGLRTASKPEPR